MNKFSNGQSAMMRSPQHTPQSQMAMNHSHVGLMPKKVDTYRMDDNMYANSIWDHHQQHKPMPNAYQQQPQTNQFKMKSPTSAYPPIPMFPNGHDQHRRPFGNGSGHIPPMPNVPLRRHDLNHLGNDSMSNFGAAAAAMNDGNFMMEKNDNRMDSSNNNNDTNNNVNDDNNKDDNKNHFHSDSNRFGNSNSYFIRSDSILTDDDFIPFDTPTQSKCGPISRKTTAKTSSPYINQSKDMSKQFPCVDSFCADITSFGATSHSVLDPTVGSSSLWQYSSLSKQSDLLPILSPNIFSTGNFTAQVLETINSTFSFFFFWLR